MQTNARSGQPGPLISGAVDNLLRFGILAWVFPVVMCYIAYFGFASDFVTNAYTTAGFDRIYFDGDYRYRLLGTDLMMAIHRAILAFDLPTFAPTTLQRSVVDFSVTLYSAFFYMNTLFLCLTLNALYLVLRGLKATVATTDSVMLIALGLLALSQYAVVPYDTISYFFVVCAAACTLCLRPGWLQVLLVCGFVVLGTMTRETVVLILAFYGAVHYRELLQPLQNLATSARLACIVLAFLATHIGLRVVMGAPDVPTDRAHYFYWNFRDNFSILGGIFFVAALLLVLLRPGGHRKMSLAFIALCSPYWVSIFLWANTREIRLWVPMLLLLMLIQVWVGERPDGRGGVVESA